MPQKKGGGTRFPVRAEHWELRTGKVNSLEVCVAFLLPMITTPSKEGYGVSESIHLSPCVQKLFIHPD